MVFCINGRNKNMYCQIRREKIPRLKREDGKKKKRNKLNKSKVNAVYEVFLKANLAPSFCDYVTISQWNIYMYLLGKD